MHNPAPVLENDSHKLLWDFNIQTDHLIPARRPDLIVIDKRKRICKIVDFAVPADHRINLKESEKKYNYLDRARELKKLWNMKVTIVLIVIGSLGTVTKGLLKGLEDLEVSGRVETIQNDSIAEDSQNTETNPGDLRDLLSVKLSEKPSANTDVKNSRGVNNKDNNNKENLKKCRLCCPSGPQNKSEGK